MAEVITSCNELSDARTSLFGTYIWRARGVQRGVVPFRSVGSLGIKECRPFKEIVLPASTSSPSSAWQWRVASAYTHSFNHQHPQLLHHNYRRLSWMSQESNNSVEAFVNDVSPVNNQGQVVCYHRIPAKRLTSHTIANPERFVPIVAQVPSE